MEAPIRIAMWSGPRNISTALMRAFENRGDCAVVDEPLYVCYLHATGIRHPMWQEILASQSHDWHVVTTELSEPLPAGTTLQYQKHMTHHMVAGLDTAWLGTVRHAFLIRDPIEMVASYAEKRGEVTPDDLGSQQQLQIYERVCELTGQAPPVIEAKDVLLDPEAMLRRLCAALGITFSAKMLSWPPGLRPSDGVWAPHWYNAVEASTGFARYESRQAVLSDALCAVAAACQPHFEALRARKLTPIPLPTSRR